MRRHGPESDFIQNGGPLFDGLTYEPAKDKERLSRQIVQVRHMMQDGRWRTLHDISVATGFPEASVSARLRDLRKERFGAWTVERRRCERGLWQYRVLQH